MWNCFWRSYLPRLWLDPFRARYSGPLRYRPREECRSFVRERERQHQEHIDAANDETKNNAERETPPEHPPALPVSTHRLWPCELVRRAQPRGELPVHLCWSGEPDFHVPVIRRRLLAFLDSPATDVAC